MILKAVALSLTPILWLTPLTQTLSLSQSERTNLIHNKYHKDTIMNYVLSTTGNFDTDGEHIVRDNPH